MAATINKKCAAANCYTHRLSSLLATIIKTVMPAYIGQRFLFFNPYHLFLARTHLQKTHAIY